MVKDPPASEANAGWIPGPGTKIPCCGAGAEPAHHKREASTLQQKIPRANQDPAQIKINKQIKKILKQEKELT